MNLKKYKKRFFTSFFLLYLTYLIFTYDLISVYCLIVLGAVSIVEFLQITSKLFKKRLTYLIVNFIFVAYIFIFCILFFIFLNFLHLKFILLCLLAACVASDIGGFIFGKLFKGPKLSKISPKKTISGSFGSFLLSIIITSILFYYFIESINLRIIVVSIITSLFSQLGDLFFSFIKRKVKIKDTGNFLPGHGGVLDRLDGILLGVPIGFIFFIITM